ncbi:hypothetical protein BDD12DRAFT_820232 [Trichophaea hybrida]|nr:hypothetical protein BDD12DRAFT_820232 [Trichophaea hybrida]
MATPTCTAPGPILFLVKEPAGTRINSAMTLQMLRIRRVKSRPVSLSPPLVPSIGLLTRTLNPHHLLDIASLTPPPQHGPNPRVTPHDRPHYSALSAPTHRTRNPYLRTSHPNPNPNHSKKYFPKKPIFLYFCNWRGRDY